jgi:hypothetical protein
MHRSFVALIVGGLTILTALVLFFVNYKQIDPRTIVLFTILLSIAISVHGLVHYVYEHHHPNHTL